MTLPNLSQFEWLAETNPSELIALIEDMKPTLLTFAAEALRLAETTPEVVKSLQTLLTHPKSYVREGALLGAAAHLEVEALKQAVEKLRNEDPFETLRDIASEILKD